MGREVAPLLDLVKGVASPYVKFPKVSFHDYGHHHHHHHHRHRHLRRHHHDHDNLPQIWVDNYVFRLHCKLTALILFLSCTLGEIPQFNVYCDYIFLGLILIKSSLFSVNWDVLGGPY